MFTTIANWSTSGLKDIAWRGKKYLWSKSREFLRFISAPQAAGETFEMATNIDDTKTRRKFEQNNWRLASPLQISVDYWLYRDYIQRSKGEFTVAKDQYVRLNTGWFSDRSACYLAAGRPVITQETGFSKFLPTGYRPKDYEHVDKNFGDNATLRALVGAAHARKLRVILDMPLAMPGFEHPFLVDQTPSERW